MAGMSGGPGARWPWLWPPPGADCGTSPCTFVDAEKCQGHNRCFAIAPELFDVDDLGNAFVIGDGMVPTELEAKARLAMANCPERAITISET